MEQFQADLDLALLHFKQLEMRIAEQQSRIVQLQESGASTETADEFLAVLQQNLALVKMHIARISKNDMVDNSSPAE